MSNKKSGLLPILVGAVAGATAVLFSNKKNREKMNQVVAKGKAQLKKLSLEVAEDPETLAKKVGKKVSSEAKKVSKEVSKEVQKLNKKIIEDQK